MRVLGQIQADQDIANKEYVDLHGGKIDTIIVDGVTQVIEDKVVNIDLSDIKDNINSIKDNVNNISNIKIKAIKSSDENAIAAYALVNTKDEATALGEIINIPKSFLVKDATLRICEEDDIPEIGFKKGDKYIDFEVNITESESKHIYLNVQDLVSVYTAGTGINIENNVISIRTDTVATKTDLETAINNLASIAVLE